MIIRNIIKQHKRNLKECNNGIKKTSDVHQIISKNHSCNEQGITLVALIVTIIVLIILSGITIASFKQSNIITRARSSAKRYSASQIDEKIDVAQQNLVAEREGYDYSIKDLVDEVKKENKDIDTIFVDESNNGRKGTYIIDDYFYDFTKKDDGIIVYNRKADASDKDKEKYENKIELKDLKSGVITFKNDKTDWTNENVNVTIGAKTDDKSIQEKIDNGTYFVVSTVNDATKLTTLNKKITSQVATNQGDTIYACLTDGYGTYVATATERIDIIDKTAPTDVKPIAKTTTNSITVTNNQEDKPGTTETKASGIKTTQYQIKKNEDATWGALQSSGTFTGLTQGIKYDVRTQVIDNAGNKTTSQITTVTTGTIGEVEKATATPTSWTNKDVTVTLPTLTGFTTMYTTNGTIPTAGASSTTKAYGSPFMVSTNCTVMYVYTDGTNINSAGTLTIDNIDKTAPTNTAPTATHTTNSITVTCKQADNAGTNEKASGIAKIEYSKDGGNTWQASNVFSGLKQNAAYTIKTRVTDKAGNVTESQTLSVTTGTISAVGKATANPTGWTNKNVTVTLPTLTGFTTKYTTNGTAPSTSSATYSSPFTVSTNCTVLYVYTDGTNINSAGTLTIDNIDKTAPTNTAPTATHTTNSITVTCKQADNAGTNEKASGIAKTEYSKDGGKAWQASNVFSGLKQNAAYTIKTRVTDKAGNVTESQTLSVTTGTISAVGKATASPTGWTNKDVTVTLPTLTGFTTKYTTNGTAPSTSSATYSSPFTVNTNCTVMYVYTDGTNINSAGTLTIDNIDKTAPTNTAPTATNTTNSITVTCKQADNAGTNEKASGIAKTEYSKDGGKTWQASNVFSGLKQNAAYTIKTRVTDKAGNVTESQTLSVTTGTISAVGKATANPTGWTNKNVTVTLPTLTGFTTKYTTNGTAPSTSSATYSSPFTVSTNCTVMYVYTDGTNINSAGTLTIDNIDKTAPTNTAPTTTNTTNSITVTCKQTDNAGTNEKASGIAKTEYSKDGGKTWQASNVFSGLKQNAAYTIKTKVTDKAGNVTESQTLSVTTGTISAVGKATASPTGWTNKDVTVTLPTLTGFTTKYTTNGTAPSTSSATYSSPFTVSTNCTVLYVYTDGTNINSAGTLTIDNIDKTAPTNTAPTATHTTNSITVTCKQADNAGTNEKASGIAKTEYSKDGGKTWQASNIFSGLKQNAAYTIKTRVTDKAGNVTESQTLSVTTGTISAVGKATANPTGWTNKNVTVTLPTLTSFTTKYTTNGTAPSTSSATYSSPFTVSTNCTVLYLYTDGTNINSAGTLTIDNIDKTAPTNTAPTATHTTNSITVTCKQADNAGTNEKASGIAKTEYSKDGGKTWQASNVFSGLKQNAAYTIKTRVTDKAGNVTESQTLSVTTGTISAVGKATASPTGWTNKDVTVTLPTLTGFTTKYTTNGTAPSTSSATYSSPFTVSTNCTVLYVYTDGTNINSAGTLTIDNIDKTAPTNTAPTATHTTNSITVTCKQADNAGTNEKASGIAKIEYSKDGGKTWQASNVFSGLKQNAAYTIKTRVTDKAGNATESQTLSVTTGTISAVGKASATPTTLTSGDVTVTLPKADGFTTKYTTNGTAPSTSSATYTGPFTVSSNCKVLYVYTDGTNINSAGTLGITNIDKTVYTITYNLNGGSISGQPTTYKVDTANITLPTPTRTGYTFNGWTGSNGTTAQKSVTIAKGSRGNKTYTANWTLPPVTTSTNYKGYYADVNDDGTVDGVIFVDLAKGASGQWGDNNNSGTYSYSAVTSGLRSYKISTKTSSYSGKFGTKQVIVPNGTSGNARFYVMALSDFDSSRHIWYDACSKTQTVGSVTFRLPSKEEWSAFGGQLGIDKSNYSSTYGLSNTYWSSTEIYGSGAAYYVYMGNDYMGDDSKYGGYYVRLCATF